jgi:hypothetical protein
MPCSEDIALWNQKSFEFLNLCPMEQELYVFAKNHGFEPLAFMEQGVSLSEALDVFLQGSALEFFC